MSRVYILKRDQRYQLYAFYIVVYVIPLVLETIVNLSLLFALFTTKIRYQIQFLTTLTPYRFRLY